MRNLNDTPDKPQGSRLTVQLPDGFSLPHTICSYGYFLLAPNRWDPISSRLYRPFTVGDDRVVDAWLSQPAPNRLRITCNQKFDRHDAAAIKQQATRMLRLDEDLAGWTQAQPKARRKKFARLFRSPTLFEDMIKTITGCNVSWPNTMNMNRLLCERIGNGGFPSPQQLASVRADVLKRWCKVGYRAKRIVSLARHVVRGDIDLTTFEDTNQPTDQVYESLRAIDGIGPYSAANLCQLLGRYEHVPIDTETYRHFKKHHRVPRDIKPKHLDQRIIHYYRSFAPYQFLAYWFELWSDYEDRYGPASTWPVDKVGANFTASVLNRST